jgi:hypothetical protein
MLPSLTGRSFTGVELAALERFAMLGLRNRDAGARRLEDDPLRARGSLTDWLTPIPPMPVATILSRRVDQAEDKRRGYPGAVMGMISARAPPVSVARR